MEDLKYSEILQKNRALRAKATGYAYKVSILSNITVNSFSEIFEYSLRLNGLNPNIEFGNFDNIVQDSANCKESALVVIFYDMLNIVDGFSGFFEDVDENTYTALRNRLFNEIDIIFSNLRVTPVVVFNRFSSAFFSSSIYQKSVKEKFVQDLNQYLEEKKPENVYLINIDKIISKIGIKTAVDYRLYHSSKAPYTLSFFKNYASSILPVVYRNTGKLKKAVIFDCDNTLWKGIIGEDGIQGIDMSHSTPQGRPYHLVQQMAVYLSKRGVIIGLCSKNNGRDVVEVLNNHQDMILKEEHIVIKKINWDDKVTNLKAIAKDLNIGTDSLIFVDDSSFEINLIKEFLPEVTCLQVPPAIYDYPRLFQDSIYEYLNLEVNNEDVKKTQIYKQQFKREEVREQFDSIDAYIASLEIQLVISKDNYAFIPRVAQLTQKTNQFNLTTLRYSETQIRQFMEHKNSCVFAATVKDKFGDNGLTAVVIVIQNEAESGEAIIDTFLMSCRIIGRNIEFVLSRYILQWLKDNGYHSVKAKYIPTSKNSQVKRFYDSLKFNVVREEENETIYHLDLNELQLPEIDYIAVTMETFQINN